MPRDSDRAARERGDGDPGADDQQVVVWHVGDAILAVPVETVVEIASVDRDGTVRSRTGTLQPITPPGLDPPASPERAVVLRNASGSLAMAADHVDGVTTCERGAATPTPEWLRTLPTRHLASLIRLDGDRVAALLAVDSLSHP